MIPGAIQIAAAEQNHGTGQMGEAGRRRMPAAQGDI